MPENEAVNELQALDAIASEQGAVLAFRMDDESPGFEPVFVRAFRANAGAGSETALIAITDQSGFSLGRYVINRDRLDRALAQAEEIGDEDSDEDAEPTLIPADWDPA